MVAQSPAADINAGMDDGTAQRQTAATAIDGPVPWYAIALLICVLGPFSLNGGFIYPANAFKLDSLGYTASVVGAVGSAGAIGYVIGSVLAPIVATAFGLRHTAIGAILLTALCILGFGVIPPVLAWYPLRLTHGIATTALFVCGESVLIGMAPAAMRGRILGFYTALNSVFFASGPAIVSMLGFKDVLPYILVAGCISLLALPMAALGQRTPQLPTVPWRQLANSVGSIPLLLTVIAAWGWIDGAMLNLWGVYAVRRGLTASHASDLMALLAFGNVFLQFPIGWLADHMPRRRVLTGLAGIGMLLSLLLPLLDIAGLPLAAVLVAIAAAGFGTFTVSLIALGDVLTGAALVAANGAFGVLWGLGDFTGALGTGALMDWVGPDAFPLALSLGFLVQCVATLILPLKLRSAH